VFRDAAQILRRYPDLGALPRSWGVAPSFDVAGFQPEKIAVINAFSLKGCNNLIQPERLK